MVDVNRVTKPKERIKASYDKLSKWYDVLAGSVEKKFRDAGLAKLAAQEGEKVLEIGFGTGYCTLALARSVGDSGKVYGLDLSEGMVNVTARKLGEAGLSNRVELQCGDAASPPYPDGFFDAVFTSFNLELFDTPEIPVVLRQCHRVLKTGGRICVVSMSKDENPGIATRAYEWAHRRFPGYIDCRPIFVTRAVESVSFKITHVTRMSLCSAPVEIVLAEKREDTNESDC